MKKSISLFLSILITLSVFTVMLCNVSAANNESVASGYYEPTELPTEALSIVTPSTAAPLPTASGIIGDCTWILENGVLTIFGNGKMGDCGYYAYDYESYHYDSSPWESYKDTIETVIIEDGVTNIGAFAFYRFSNLKDVTIPDSVTNIGGSAFWGCSGLSSIEIPSSVSWVGRRAFYECTGLKGVYISDLSAWCRLYFESKYTQAFHYYCNGTNPLEYAHNLYLNNEMLTDIVIPDSVTYTGYDVFCNCSNLKSVTLNQSGIDRFKSTFSGCDNIETIILKDGVTSINSSKDSDGRGTQGFDGYRSIKSITIPSSVMNIDNYAFESCTGLTSITVDTGNRLFDSRDNCNAIIDTRTNQLVRGCQTTVIPDTIKSIGDSAFSGCTGLTSIVIPDSVTRLGEYAFSGCTGLTNIVIPDSVTSLGEKVFCGCYGLTNATINCSGYIDDQAFWWCTNLKNVTIGRSVTSIGEYAFYECRNLTSINIPSSIRSIGNFAFYNCKGVKSVTIPASVTSIGEKAFGYYDEYPLGEKTTEGFTVYGYNGTQAYDYAWYNYLDFVALPNSLGDADGNENIESVDATYIQRYLAEIEIPYTKEQLMSGDVDGSGDLELFDVTCIQRYLAHLKTDYAIGQPVS